MKDLKRERSRGWRTLAVGVVACAFMAAAASRPPDVETKPGSSRAGLTERPGGQIPGDLVAVDEQGRAVRLVDLIDRPVLLALVYYTCEHVCPLVLSALGGLAADKSQTPGRDYRIITLSFDGSDAPPEAATARTNFTKPLGSALPAEAWSFLTASPETIVRLTEAVGFRFEPAGHGFVHPSVLIVLSPGGRISSYVHVSRTAYGVGYPVAFPPGPMAAALRTAAAGGAGVPDPAPVLFCYPGEPPAQSRFFDLMRSMGLGTLALLAGLFVYLAFVWKRPVTGAGGP